jgi:hypothetical protein
VGWAEAFVWVSLSLIPTLAIVAIVWIGNRNNNVGK